MLIKKQIHEIHSGYLNIEQEKIKRVILPSQIFLSKSWEEIDRSPANIPGTRGSPGLSARNQEVFEGHVQPRDCGVLCSSVYAEVSGHTLLLHTHRQQKIRKSTQNVNKIY